MRIQVNPSRFPVRPEHGGRAHGAGTQASVNSAKGNFDGPRQDYQIDANDQITEANDYKDVVVAYRTARRCSSKT